VADLAVAGPLGELHFGQPRLDPVRPFRERPGWRRVERRGVDLDGLEQSAELAAERIVPAPTRANFPGEPERASFVVPDEDRPDAFARPFRIRESADHKLLAPNAFSFPPIVRARPGPVGCRAALADDAFRAEPARVGEHRPAVPVEVGGIANDAGAVADEGFQPLEARAPTLVEDDHLAVTHRGPRARSG